MKAIAYMMMVPLNIIVTFQITTATGRTLSFGLSEIFGGDAASTLQSFTESIDDLCMAIDSKDNETDFAKLISS